VTAANADRLPPAAANGSTHVPSADNRSLSSRTALVAGASGLVGRHLIDALLASPHYARITAVVRRPLARNDPRLDVRVVDFKRLTDAAPVSATDAFCALGTTIAAAGSREAFAAVDLHHVTAFARFARAGGARRLVVVSSVGADPSASNFYLRVKGQAERAVAAIGFEKLDIIRPGLLLGARAESRPAEALAQRVMPAIAFAFTGPLRKYRPVQATVVAHAMVGTALAQHEGVRVLEYDLIRSMAASAGDARS
jgi:uncharacterized protein YbjT (DUF2867 family)